MASEAKWKIKIKTLKADSFDLEMTSDSTVDQLKKQIETVKQIAPSLQRLIFRGRILKASTKLKEYEITNGSTIHLVVRKTSSTTPSTNAQNTQNTQNATNNNNNNTNGTNNPQNNAFSNIQHHQQAQMSAIQQMFSNLTGYGQQPQPPPPQQQQQQQQQQQPQPQQQQTANGNNNNNNNPMPQIPPQMVIRRMAMQSNATNTNTIRNVYDNDDDDNKSGQDEVYDVDKADYDEAADIDILSWKLKRSKLQNWIKNGNKYCSYFSDEQETRNGSVWRFFVYPAGINQGGYHEDTVLFIMLCSLPFGVEALDIEFALHFSACNVNFKFRKTFNPFIRSAGWPRNFLSMRKILDIGTNKKYVKFTCDLKVHSVIMNGNRMSHDEYMNMKQNNNGNGIIAISPKPNGKLFRWKLDKKMFISAQFKQYQQSKTFNICGFKFYVQIYPNGLQRNGCVQPYLHLIGLPQTVTKLDAAFSFYLREINIGYCHCDIFNGKMGKGWPEMKLKRDDIKWNNLNSITMECRVNILNVSVNSNQWFVDRLKLEKEKERPMNGDDEKREQKHEENEKEKVNDNMNLREWLIKIGAHKYYDKFIENEIVSLDDVIQYIEERNNLKECGIKPFGDRVKIWKNIQKLRQMRQREEEEEEEEEEASTF